MNAKNILLIIAALVIFFLVFLTGACSAGTRENHPPDALLDQHRRFSPYTDPGAFGYLYKQLPESLDELCVLIKKQLIHPFDLERYAGKIPKNRVSEDRQLPTVSLMLKKLLERNENGLVATRKPEERLVVACVHHCMLLTSILRSRGTPVRIRAGFAKYIGGRKGIRVTHTICEVWDEKDNRWILVDPDRQKIDFPYHEFAFAHETWIHLRNEDLGSEEFISRYGSVDRATVHLLCHDLSYFIGEEEPYWLDPPIVSRVTTGISDLSEAERLVLDKIAGYLQDPDHHFHELVSIQEETPFLQFKKEKGEERT